MQIENGLVHNQEDLAKTKSSFNIAGRAVKPSVMDTPNDKKWLSHPTTRLSVS